MNKTLKAILIPTAYQFVGGILIILGFVSIADRFKGFPMVFIMILSLFIWAIIVTLWCRRGNDE